jgi:hypothetical protein
MVEEDPAVSHRKARYVYRRFLLSSLLKKGKSIAYMHVQNTGHFRKDPVMVPFAFSQNWMFAAVVGC